VQERDVLNTKMNSRIPKQEVRFKVTRRQEASPKDPFFYGANLLGHIFALLETKLSYVKFDKILL
jgi:hypothetical protein